MATNHILHSYWSTHNECHRIRSKKCAKSADTISMRQFLEKKSMDIHLMALVSSEMRIWSLEKYHRSREQMERHGKFLLTVHRTCAIKKCDAHCVTRSTWRMLPITNSKHQCWNHASWLPDRLWKIMYSRPSGQSFLPYWAIELINRAKEDPRTNNVSAIECSMLDSSVASTPAADRTVVVVNSNGFFFFRGAHRKHFISCK